jgi:hypothetical protein
VLNWPKLALGWIIADMSWALVSSTVLPLAGVALGAASTLVGQYLALRGGAPRDAAQRAAEQRAERKEAIIGFLSAAISTVTSVGSCEQLSRGTLAGWL